MQLVIERQGSVRCIYSEAVDLTALGKIAVQRGSYVEPDDMGVWWADLSPVHGPKLGPFRHRSPALAAEIAWLESNWLLESRSQ